MRFFFLVPSFLFPISPPANNKLGNMFGRGTALCVSKWVFEMRIWFYVNDFGHSGKKEYMADA